MTNFEWNNINVVDLQTLNWPDDLFVMSYDIWVKTLSNNTGGCYTIMHPWWYKSTFLTMSQRSSCQTKKPKENNRRLMAHQLSVAQRKTLSPHSMYCGRQMPSQARRSQDRLCHIWCKTMQLHVCVVNASDTIDRKEMSQKCFQLRTSIWIVSE